jgi:cytochrome c oxidase subunit 4
MSHHGDHNHSEQHHPHIMPLWIYLAVGGTLLVLTGVTIGAAYINFNALTGFSSMNFIIAMLIATVKATLVGLFFMHLFYDNKLYSFSLGIAIACLFIFIGLTMSDTARRGYVNEIEAGPIQTQVPKENFVQSKEHDTHDAHAETAPAATSDQAHH